MTEFMLWMAAGGVLGYAASRIARRFTSPGTLLNVLAGVVGGFMSGLVIKSALAAVNPEMARLGLWSLMAALAGASLLLVVVNLPARSQAVKVAVEAAERETARS